jgi:hypothetical protein
VAGALSALVPPRPSVLPPGAGNEEAGKALKAGKERANKVEERYAEGIEVADGHGHLPAIRPDGDGDCMAIPAPEQVQAIRLLVARERRVRAV